MIHQAARMLWLGDRMGEIAKGRPALRLLFHVIAPEAVAKLVNNFKAKGSRADTFDSFSNTSAPVPIVSLSVKRSATPRVGHSCRCEKQLRAAFRWTSGAPQETLVATRTLRCLPRR